MLSGFTSGVLLGFLFGLIEIGPSLLFLLLLAEALQIHVVVAAILIWKKMTALSFFDHCRFVRSVQTVLAVNIQILFRVLSSFGYF